MANVLISLRGSCRPQILCASLLLLYCLCCCIAANDEEEESAIYLQSGYEGLEKREGPSIEEFGVAGGEEEIIQAIKAAAEDPEILEWMTEVRRHIHQNPELSWEEFATSAYIRKQLDGLRIPYEWPVAKTGIVGILGSGNEPFIALRAEMDALPIQELGEWEHKSKVPSKMHACGHDAHLAMLLAAARILQSRRHGFQGTVRLLFQPAEEGGAGAKFMVEEEALGKAKAIFGLHISSLSPTGTVSLKPGSLMAGSGIWEAIIYGQGGHAALPQHTVDPIVAAAATVLVLQQLVSREADPLDPQVVSVAFINGGKAFNIIPDKITMGGTFRALSIESFRRIKKRIEEVIVNQAKVHLCRASVSFKEESHPFYPATVNDAELYEHVKSVSAMLLGADNVKAAVPVMGAEDFAFYMQQIPGYYMVLGMRNETVGSVHSIHNDRFTVDENVLHHGAALLASVAETYLNKL